MANWRRPILNFYDTRISHNRVPDYVGLLQECYAKPQEQRRAEQADRLAALLQHAWLHVPLYRKALSEAGAVRGGRVDLAKFRNVPELTREGLRSNFEHLRSDDLGSRTWYRNSSGGSSGEPVIVLQDDVYHDLGIATTEMHYRWADWEPGQPLARLWGSERDLLLGSTGWRNKLSGFVRNRTELNAFRMAEPEMARHASAIQRSKPVLIEAYAESAFEFARYLNVRGIRLADVRRVITSAGTLYPFMRDEIERAFGCQILNRYGSREVGDCAGEREPGGGLEVFTYTHLLEVLNEMGEPCEEGEEGEVVVTCLSNTAMPIIRYRIGDRAVVGARTPGPLASVERLQMVTGRTTDAFVRDDGSTVPAAFFIHFIGVVHNAGWVRKTQIIQRSHQSILVKLAVMRPPEPGALEGIRASMWTVMGPACRIDFEFVDDIPPLPSGKYRYTVSLVPQQAPARADA